MQDSQRDRSNIVRFWPLLSRLNWHWTLVRQSEWNARDNSKQNTGVMFLPSPTLFFVHFSFFSIECRQFWGASPHAAVSGTRLTIEFWKWHGTRQKEHEASSPPSGLHGHAAHSFITALAGQAGWTGRQWKIYPTMFPHHHCLLSDL